MKTYKGYINFLEDNQIFCFGSNPEGKHGAGTARIALEKYGAVYGKGRGLFGKSYGIVTKNLTDDFVENNGIEYKISGLRSVTKEQIVENIKELYDFANKNKDLEFLIAYAPYGKLLNGYSINEMAEMFNSYNIPENIVFNEDFFKLF